MQQSDLLKSISQGKMNSMQIGVIMICWLINMLDGFDVLAIAYTAPSISEEWQLSPGKLGVVLSAGLAGMALGALFIAPLADLFGRRKIILVSRDHIPHAGDARSIPPPAHRSAS
jgi:predicted MFS family arabinose efflux permease